MPLTARFLFLWLLAILWPALSGALPVLPYEKEEPFKPYNALDTLWLKGLEKEGLSPAPLCSDAVFLRRVFLDAVGALPDPYLARDFLESQDPEKRQKLVAMLLEEERFNWYWAQKWSDVLRVKAEFPINLWPNAVQAYHRYIYSSLRERKPWNVFARELLCSSGSNFRVPPVNFYRAVQGKEPETLARAAALTFLGMAMDKWPREKQEGFALFFSRVAFKGTAEWKEEIVYLNPAPAEAFSAIFPDGKKVWVSAQKDPREIFADWLLSPENPAFARSVVNRQWAWVFGRGLIEEADDIRPDNPPVYPEVLEFLTRRFMEAGYDWRETLALIFQSRLYQQSAIPRGDSEKARVYFACYPLRRLEAETLNDALNQVLGASDSYSSAIPEPFTFTPDYHPTTALADGSISSPFLELFGRPSRDTGLMSERSNQPTANQCMYLLNASGVLEKVQKSQRLRGIQNFAGPNKTRLIQGLYLSFLSRFATKEEVQTALNYLQKNGKKTALEDLAWALVNTKEFLYRH